MPTSCPYALRADISTPPRFMQELPIDERGYPVPWFVEWIDGKPEFRAMSAQKLIKAINEHRCWVCGEKLFRELIFTIGPMCAVNRISAEPPSHRECARYAAIACPFLSKPQMIRRKDRLPADVSNHDSSNPRNPGVTLLWYVRSHRPVQIETGILFELGQPFRTEWYAHGRPATRAEILESLESGIQLLRQEAIEEGPEAEAELDRRIPRAMALVPR